MKKLTKWIGLFCVMPILFAACAGGGGGDSASTELEPNLVLELTDAPGDYLSVFITIDGIYAIIDESDPIRLEFADFDSPAVVEETDTTFTVDLIQLSGGESIEMALGDLPEGMLNQLRLIISDASLIAYEDVVGLDGPDPGTSIDHVEAEFDVKVPSGPQTGVKLNPRNIEIQSGELTSLTLDFDADKSIVQLGSAKKRDYNFILKPVIFILDAVGSNPVDAETMAIGFNFPTGLQVAEDVGPASVVGEGEILVADVEEPDDDDDAVYNVDVSGGTPVDVGGLAPFASSDDDVEVAPGEFELLVNYPTGVAQYKDIVWISNLLATVAVDNAGTVSEIYTDGSFSNIFIDNDAPTESVEGLMLTSGVEFGGFAPDGSLSEDEFLVFQTNGNGSVTGLDLKDSLIFDLLPAATFSDPTDAAFIPNTIEIGDPAGTVIGWLYVTDADTDEVALVELTTTGGIVGDTATGLNASILDTFIYAFSSEPVGIAYCAASNRLYIANRGNGSIIAIQPDGTEIETYDTGLGGNAINGIDVVSDGAEDTIFLTNTAGNILPPTEDDAMGTIEKVVITLP